MCERLPQLLLLCHNVTYADDIVISLVGGNTLRSGAVFGSKFPAGYEGYVAA